MRTTLDIDQPILRELKVRAKREKKSLGRLASDLLGRALGEEAAVAAAKGVPVEAWTAKPMRARVDLSDSEALYAAMEGEALPDARVAEGEGR